MICFFRTTDSHDQMSGRTSPFYIITQIELFDLAGPHTLDRVLTVYTKSAPCVCVCRVTLTTSVILTNVGWHK